MIASLTSIHAEIDKKIMGFLSVLITAQSQNRRPMDVFFDYLVNLCENDLDFSAFIRETEIQGILLSDKIIGFPESIDFRDIQDALKRAQ